jgi:hypothetical protein
MGENNLERGLDNGISTDDYGQMGLGASRHDC